MTKAKCGSKEPQGSFRGRAPANNAKNAKSATIEKKKQHLQDTYTKWKRDMIRNPLNAVNVPGSSLKENVTPR